MAQGTKARPGKLRPSASSPATAEPEASTRKAMDHSALGHLLGYAIARANVVTRRAFQQAIGEPLDLRPVEFAALILLQQNRDVTHARLARALALSAPNLTTMLDRLVERKLVQRVRSESDRRAQLVTLTREGAQLAARAQKISLSMEDQVLAVFSDAERAILIELLLRVRSADGKSDAA